MAEGYEQSNEFRRTRRPGTIPGSQSDSDGTAAPSQDSPLPSLHSLMWSAGTGASYNAPVRAQAMQQMQHTHGNRAVQRYIQRNTPQAGTKTVPVQRSTAAPTPAKGSPRGGRPETWWQSLWKGVENILPKPGPDDNENVVGRDSDGNVEYVHDEAPKCYTDRQGNTRGSEQICPDPWDWSRSIVTYKDRKEEKVPLISSGKR